MDLHETWKVGKDDYPQLKLFIKGNPEPVNYTGNWEAEEIKRFLKTRGGIHERITLLFFIIDWTNID